MILTNVPRSTIFSVALSQLIATLGFATVTRASSVMPAANEYAIEFHHPEDRGAPDVAVGGSPRCGSKFTPLLPHDASKDYGEISPPYFSLTVRPNPTFWLHFPENVAEVLFEIVEYDTDGRGKDGDVIYSTIMKLPNADRFVSFPLPGDVVLEPGKIYRWYLDAAVGYNAVEVVSQTGWIERVEVSPTLRKQLVLAKTPLDRAQVYAEAGIWHDAIEILVQERRLGDSPELEAEWKEFLMSADFAEYVTEIPLLDCCGDRASEPR